MKERLSNSDFKVMQTAMQIIDHIHPHVLQKADSFGIMNGMTVVDYGCGPGRYSVEFARLVGENGKVLAVDLIEVALRETEKKPPNRDVKMLKPIWRKAITAALLLIRRILFLRLICSITFKIQPYS